MTYSTYETRRNAAMMEFARAVLETYTSAEFDEHEEGYASDGECLDYLLAKFRDNLLMYVPDEYLREDLKKRMDGSL